MAEQQYNTRHHQLPLTRVKGRVAIVVAETSNWFWRSIQEYLSENTPVRVDAAPGYAYLLEPKGLARDPVLAVRLILRWDGGRLWLDRARAPDGQLIDLDALLKVQSLEEVAAETLQNHKDGDSTLSSSGLLPHVQLELADVARQETALRRALLAAVHHGNADALCLCVKLLGASFGGYNPKTDLYQQAATKFETLQYAPHLRDLLTNLVSSPQPSALHRAAKSFCQHLHEAGIEDEWVTDLLKTA